MIYQAVSDSYLKNQLHKDLYADLYIPCYNLSAILCDLDGKISNQAVIILKQNLQIINPGILLSGKSIVKSLLEDTETPIPKETFASEVTYSAYKFIESISKTSTDVISSSIISEMLKFNKYNILKSEYQSAICSIYLESFCLYKILVNIDPSVGIEKITILDIERIINNIRCVSNKLETLDKPQYDYIEILRDLHKVLAYIKSLEYLFTKNYIQKISEYKQTIGEG